MDQSFHDQSTRSSLDGRSPYQLSGRGTAALFSPDGNQVAFSWNGEKQDNFDIYIKDVGSGAQRRLTTAKRGGWKETIALLGRRTAAPLRLSAERLEGKPQCIWSPLWAPPSAKWLK